MVKIKGKILSVNISPEKGEMKKNINYLYYKQSD